MKKIFIVSCLLLCRLAGIAQDIVLHQPRAGAFPLVSANGATSIYVDSNDHWLVRQAAVFLSQDIQRVTGQLPVIVHSLPASAAALIIISSKSSDDSVRGKWEAFSIAVRSHPQEGIGQALVITGSDRRGTAYGVFELSKQIGVSPWYWWADVPVKKSPELYIRSDAYVSQHPDVKYRGFFINDEAPALSGWTKEKFGGVNHHFYEKVFQLLLRMKANFLWPAMWGNAFNDDDTLNPVLADKYGIVMGTSHHEPMLRAQQEWKRYGSGPWNYDANAAVLDSFWRLGIRHMGSHESIVTIGMRGDGDMPMTEGSNIALLEKIVRDQRKIIRDVTGKAPEEVPQSWALYKEVQDYYDKGMRVPDDVTLLLCDDNWGDVRKLPDLTEKPRKGGYGMYYHFDYVGDPRNYKWLNTNSIPRVWEQMHLTKSYGVDRLWIVNVGDIKPMEMPIEFFLDYAWAPDKWPADSLDAWVRGWAARQFGAEHADAIAHILQRYTFFNNRRKPELLSPDTYSLLHYREAERVAADYNALADSAAGLGSRLPAEYRDAYYQLVLHPVQACANLNELYYTVARNRLYASQGRASANKLADRAGQLYVRDSLISRYYNDTLAGGKWRHMMDQTHIGYTYWQQPPFNTMPEVKRLSPSEVSSWGVTVEGSTHSWPRDTGAAVLPIFEKYGAEHYFDFFRRSATDHYTITSGADGVQLRFDNDPITGDVRVYVKVLWEKVPVGVQRVPIRVTGPDQRYVDVMAVIFGQGFYTGATPGFLAEADGYISVEAAHYNKAVETNGIHWQNITGVGKTLSGMEAMPVTVPHQVPGDSSPRLEYKVFVLGSGPYNVHAFFSPTLNFSGKGLRYAVSFDDQAPQIIDLAHQDWSKGVADNIYISTSQHKVSKGRHVLKYWLVDPGVVLQKIVISMLDIKPSYLGPPPSQVVTEPGLKDYYNQYFPVGVAVGPRDIQGPDSTLIIREFSSLTPENAMKMGPIHPEESRYNWKDADAIVDFATRHNMRIRGHNLCWHEQTPDWLFKDAAGRQVSKEVLLQRLKEHITTVVSRYKGRIYAWDVVNEAVSDDSTQFLRHSTWYKICGDEFIIKAFQWAHEADPQAQLFYNDYNTERPWKREKVYQLLEKLLAAKVPITGVGLQGHWSIYEPSAQDLSNAINRFQRLGLAVQVTELDMSIYPWEKNARSRRPGESDAYTPEVEQRQTDQYGMVFSIFRKNRINGVTFWNVTDKHTWLDTYPVPGRKNYPLLFDTSGQPKKAYWKVARFD